MQQLKPGAYRRSAVRLLLQGLVGCVRHGLLFLQTFCFCCCHTTPCLDLAMAPFRDLLLLRSTPCSLGWHSS